MITAARPMTVQEIIGAAKQAAANGHERWWDGITELLRLQALAPCTPTHNINVLLEGEVPAALTADQLVYSTFWGWTARRACREFARRQDLEQFTLFAGSVAVHPVFLNRTDRVETRLSPCATVYMPYATARVATALIRITKRIC